MDKSWWAEIKNDYIEDIDTDFTIYSDNRKELYIDAWLTDSGDEEGSTIAKVILSKSGDISVVYIDNMSYGDELAQQKIKEAIQILQEVKNGYR